MTKIFSGSYERYGASSLWIKMQHIRASVETLKADEALNETTESRQKNHLNNIRSARSSSDKTTDEGRHGKQERSTQRARRLRGFGAMNMLRKGQVVEVRKGDVLARTEFMSQIFGVVA